MFFTTNNCVGNRVKNRYSFETKNALSLSAMFKSGRYYITKNKINAIFPCSAIRQIPCSSPRYFVNVLRAIYS